MLQGARHIAAAEGPVATRRTMLESPHGLKISVWRVYIYFDFMGNHLGKKGQHPAHPTHEPTLMKQHSLFDKVSLHHRLFGFQPQASPPLHAKTARLVGGFSCLAWNV